MPEQQVSQSESQLLRGVLGNTGKHASSPKGCCRMSLQDDVIHRQYWQA